ncbi:MAG: cation efflux protein [Actinobacteria bacterium]|nr:cation efflux protein [Actinomycetota bacterium]
MTQVTPERARSLGAALRLEYVTVGWNTVEAVVALAAGAVAGSQALIGFGGDSVVESLSGTVLIWRLAAERRPGGAERAETVERRARRGVAASLWVLAAYVAAQAIYGLVAGAEPEASPVGLGLAVASLCAMWLLARAKRRRARELHSHALEVDAVQTELCWRLSAVLLVGLGLNAALGWWWADSAAALALSGLIAYEGREAWEEKHCC